MKSKYKILVLSDLKNSANSALKSAISLAKIIGGSIEFFHVKNPTKVVERDNQLSAIRTINDDYTITKRKIESLIEPFLKEYEVQINYTFSFGNVKNEIENYISENKPDIIVLGKRKSKKFKLGGDSITEFILKKHKGVILIGSNENTLEPNKLVSLGLLNHTEQLCNVEFAKDLIDYTQKPLKAFKINNGLNSRAEEVSSTDVKTIEYVFEENDNTFNNLSKYISKSAIDLVCINRQLETSKNLNAIKELINKINVSLLIANEQNFKYNNNLIIKN